MRRIDALGTVAAGLLVYGLMVVLPAVSKAKNAGTLLGASLCKHAKPGVTFQQAFVASKAELADTPEDKSKFDYSITYQEVMFRAFDDELAKCGKSIDIRGVAAAKKAR